MPHTKQAQPALPTLTKVSDKSPKTPRSAGRKGNDLDGATWTRYSISVWNDIRKNTSEVRMKHPAMFPISLVSRLIECFTTHADSVVLDPFLGSGSTLVAADAAGKMGVGFEISDEYIALARQRLDQSRLFGKSVEHRVVKADARLLEQHLEPNSVGFCVTSPPYWNILNQRRSADGKARRHYGNMADDLGTIVEYEAFLDVLTEIFVGVLHVLVPGKYCVVNVMDLRKKGTFFPFHSDLARRMSETGWIYDDLIIWDRRQEYNNLRPLGYPFVFRINKVHEYLLIFRKPNGT